MMKQERNTQVVYSKVVKAGRRIYYLDVKKSQQGELYLVVTESKLNAKRHSIDEPLIERYRVMVFPKDFQKLKKELLDVVAFIERNSPEGIDDVASDDAEDENILRSGHPGDIDLDIEF
jgi:hypothetical protein